MSSVGVKLFQLLFFTAITLFTAITIFFADYLECLLDLG